MAKDKVIQGLLPDIKVPAITSDVKYCQISVQDGSGVDFNFVVSGKPAVCISASNNSPILTTFNPSHLHLIWFGSAGFPLTTKLKIISLNQAIILIHIMYFEENCLYPLAVCNPC
jgi:hypothetical protein